MASRHRTGMTLWGIFRFSLVLLRQRRASRTRLRGHDRADKQAAVGCNLSCERNAFQGHVAFVQVGWRYFRLNLSCERNAFQGKYVDPQYLSTIIKVLISLARGMLFRESQVTQEKFLEFSVLISLARGMLFRDVLPAGYAYGGFFVLISLARGMLFRVCQKLLAVGPFSKCLNLSCERNAFQGCSKRTYREFLFNVLISLARGMLFRDIKNRKVHVGDLMS